MIYIKDNFLDQKLFDLLQDDVKNFEKVDTPGKSFWVHLAEKNLIKYISSKLGIIEGCVVENVLAFFREAKEGQDNDWRIHNDTIINDQQPDRAIVLYLSPIKKKALNGTAFWEHKEYGDVYPKGKSTEEFNRMLKQDANDVSKWDLRSIISHKENRLISYPCKYFHSKYPNEFEESRIVLVMFYKTKKYERKND
tara:strand:+ start:47 stop:631 length:585 start_codon:yes stop_codon:yes gene_type:complete